MRNNTVPAPFTKKVVSPTSYFVSRRNKTEVAKAIEIGDGVWADFARRRPNAKRENATNT